MHFFFQLQGWHESLGQSLEKFASKGIFPRSYVPHVIQIYVETNSHENLEVHVPTIQLSVINQ